MNSQIGFNLYSPELHTAEPQWAFQVVQSVTSSVLGPSCSIFELVVGNGSLRVQLKTVAVTLLSPGGVGVTEGK